MELSTYFRINAAKTGQFERTLIVAEEGGHVSYMEGCTAPMRDENQFHAAIVEIVAWKDAQIKYSTVQTGIPETNRAGEESTTSSPNAAWLNGECQDQLDTGGDRLSGNLEVSELHPAGDNTVGEFYSVAVTNNYPAGRHRDENDTPWAKIHAGPSFPREYPPARANAYRGLVRICPKALALATTASATHC